MFTYSIVCFIYIPITFVVLPKTCGFAISTVFLVTFVSIFLSVHMHVATVWQLACVVSVLEPVYGLGAMKKSLALLEGKTTYALVLAVGYSFFCGVVWSAFHMVERHSWEVGIVRWVRILLGGV